MARERNTSAEYTTPLRNLLLAILVLCLFGLFLLWRIDNPRVERMRAQITDRLVPNMEWAMAPVTGTINLVRDFQSYRRIAEQNRELRAELRKMDEWREAAIQLRDENARLRDLNNVQLDPRLTYITGVVLADSGSPFRQSVLLNIGKRDGIVDGWAAMDGLGVVGRISGVAENTSRVLMLTDANSRIPAIIQPSGQRAIVAGDNSALPPVDFIENRDVVRPGDRLVSSGDGGVFPAGLLIGTLVADVGGRLRVRLAADYERLEFLRIMRHHGTPGVEDSGSVVGDVLPEQEDAARAGAGGE